MRVRGSILLVTMVVLALVLPGSGGSATAEDPGLGVITGAATDAADGGPATGVHARLYRYDDAAGFVPAANSPVYTGPQGNYSFSGLQPGHYTVEFSDATDTYVTSTWPGGPGATGTKPRVPSDAGVVQVVAPVDPGAGERVEPPVAELDVDLLRVLRNEGEPPMTTGTLRAGYGMGVRVGGWNVGDATFAYQWQRVSGEVATDIRGATAASYVLTGSDVGREVRVELTGLHDGYLGEPGYSEARPIGKGLSTTTARLSRTKVRTTARGRVAVVVGTAPTLRPTGWVSIKVDGRQRAATKLGTTQGGRATVTLPRLKKGRHRVVATYLGSSVLVGSTARPLTLTVVR